MKDADAYFVDGPVPETPENPQHEETWAKTRVVGTRQPHVDAYERVSGTAVYPHDVSLPDMLHGAILRCPHPHAKVVRIDTATAEK
ncbi:MAG: xanthine dehydrogenase family protein molybdopterin-binding subunit, partial [bacterium]|nr:xanthine dehydrogenase family protein molybdopterin-binding subunit [bacterium]